MISFNDPQTTNNFEFYRARVYYENGIVDKVTLTGVDKYKLLELFKAQSDQTLVIQHGDVTNAIKIGSVSGIEIRAYMDWPTLETVCNMQLEAGKVTKNEIENFLGVNDPENILEFITLEDIIDAFKITDVLIRPEEFLLKNDWRYEDGQFVITKEDKVRW